MITIRTACNFVSTIRNVGQLLIDGENNEFRRIIFEDASASSFLKTFKLCRFRQSDLFCSSTIITYSNAYMLSMSFLSVPENYPPFI